MAKPKWFWKETAEVIGALGIIAGIVFLGLELQQNNELMSAQQRFNQLSIISATPSMVAQSPELAEAMAVLNPEYVEAYEKWAGGASSLTPGQLNQLWNLAVRTIMNQQWQFQELPRDQLPVGFWRFTASQQHWQYIWSSFNFALDPEFVAYMEENVIYAQVR